MTSANGPLGIKTSSRSKVDRAPNIEGSCNILATPPPPPPELCGINPGTITTLTIRNRRRERMKNGSIFKLYKTRSRISAYPKSSAQNTAGWEL